MKKLLLFIFCIVVFGIVTAYAAEFLINRSSSDLQSWAFVAIEVALIYVLIFKPFKTLFK